MTTPVSNVQVFCPSEHDKLHDLLKTVGAFVGFSQVYADKVYGELSMDGLRWLSDEESTTQIEVRGTIYDVPHLRLSELDATMDGQRRVWHTANNSFVYVWDKASVEDNWSPEYRTLVDMMTMRHRIMVEEANKGLEGLDTERMSSAMFEHTIIVRELERWKRGNRTVEHLFAAEARNKPYQELRKQFEGITALRRS